MICYEADNDIFELAVSLIKERVPEIRTACEHDGDDLTCHDYDLHYYERRVFNIFKEARHTILERGGERTIKPMCKIILFAEIKDDISFVSDEEYEEKYGVWDDEWTYTFTTEHDGLQT